MSTIDRLWFSLFLLGDNELSNPSFQSLSRQQLVSRLDAVLVQHPHRHWNGKIKNRKVAALTVLITNIHFESNKTVLPPPPAPHGLPGAARHTLWVDRHRPHNIEFHLSLVHTERNKCGGRSLCKGLQSWSSAIRFESFSLLLLSPRYLPATRGFP